MDVSDVPWDALHFLTAEIYYGGRVTDEFDRRCLMVNLQRFCSDLTVDASADDVSPWVELLADGSLHLSGVHQLFATNDDSFTSPLFTSREVIAAFVNELPPTMDAPFVFGMHPIANVFYLKQETQRLVSQILQLQAIHEDEAVGNQGDGGDEVAEDDDVDVTPLAAQLMRRQSSQLEKQRKSTVLRNGSLSGVEAPETVALHVAEDIQQKLPQPSTSEQPEGMDDSSRPEDDEDVETVDPFTVVLRQERAKSNSLLAAVHDGLRDVQRAIQGRVVMSPTFISFSYLRSSWRWRYESWLMGVHTTHAVRKV